MSEKRKRITVKLKTPNPLFEKWISEWRDKAKEENSKMQYTFSRALFWLRKYPMPLERGKDCKILKGFGDKICKMLDNKLKEHKKNKKKGILDNTIIDYAIPDKNEEADKKKKDSKPVQERSKKQKSPSKEYIPKEGSGGYAILITLYRKSLEPSYPGYLTKLEFVRETQYFSNTSFTKPDPGSRYTAWSSMRTLISKNLVKRESHPPKFSLTDEGLLLAKKLSEKGKSTDSCNNTLDLNNSCDVQRDQVVVSDEEHVPETKSVSTFNSKISSGYSNEDNIVASQSTSKTIQKYSSSSSYSSSSMQRDMADLWNEEVILETRSSGTTTSTIATSDSISSVMSSFGSSSEENRVVGRSQTCKTIKKYASSSSIGSSTQLEANRVVGRSKTCKTIKKYASSSSFASSTQLEENRSQTCKTIRKNASSSSIASSTQSSSQEESVIFLPDTFDIILYVDTQETGGSNVDVQDDPILAELKCLSVPYEVKNLKVGDYTWICRDRTTKIELVLPYVMERKRTDDLAKSIKDGRYYEQKFRLKKSCIENITYLIENYGKIQYAGLPIASLHQAATNTAVQDGFCVKFAENYKDTAKYLANFSVLLSKMFKSKMLVSCPKENLSEVSLNDDLIALMTFKEFNKSSAKSKPLRVLDLFVKMLIQIRGMSVDKALAIVREYPTPETLRRAYEVNPGTNGEKLLAQIQFGDCKKMIGQVLSKTVYQLFTMETF